jgi:hypothetical protein
MLLVIREIYLTRPCYTFFPVVALKHLVSAGL